METNLYAYVGNNPTNYIDPLGLEKIDGNNITVHRNDVDPWPSQPHGHIYDKNRVVDIDGKIFDKTTRKEVCQLSKKGKTKWLKFLRGKGYLGLLLLFVGDVGDNIGDALASPFLGASDAE